MLERADPAHFQIFAHRLLNPCVARTKYEHLSTHILAPDRCRRSPPTCTLPVPAYFRRLESRNFNRLVLIRFLLAPARARGRRPGTLTAAAPGATQAPHKIRGPQIRCPQIRCPQIPCSIAKNSLFSGNFDRRAGCWLLLAAFRKRNRGRSRGWS